MSSRPATTGLERHANRRTLAARWKHAELFQHGYVPVPVALLLHNQHLRPGIAITPPQFVFLLHLMSHKWDENMPYPSYARIAQRMGVTLKVVRRYAKQLEQNGFLKRERRFGGTNVFNLDPLFDALLLATAQANTAAGRAAKAASE